MINSIKRLINYWRSPTQRVDAYKNFAFDTRGSDFANFVGITFFHKDCEFCRSLQGMLLIGCTIGNFTGMFGVRGFLFSSAFFALFFCLWFCFIKSVQTEIEREMEYNSDAQSYP